MESTLLTSFLKASKIRQWLTNPQTPSIIWEIQSLYDRIYTPNSADTSDTTNDDDKLPTWGLAGLAIPKDLQPLLCPGDIEIHLQARLKQEGVIYLTSKTHKGNSQIFFYPDGDRTLAPVVGFIQYIYSEGKKSNKTLLTVKHAITVDKSVTDPFAKYMHWPAWLYHSGLNKSCEWIPSEWISGHFVRWDVSSEHMVVLSLSWVSSFSYTISSFWQVYPRIDFLVVLFVNTLQSTCFLKDLMIFGIRINSFKAQGFRYLLHFCLCCTVDCLVFCLLIFLLLKIKNDLSIQSLSMPRLCTVLLHRQNFGLGQALCVTCAVPAWVIKNCFLVRLKHRAKKGFFTWNGAVFSTKIYCLNTKMHTKGCFGHNRRSVCGDFFTLTIELAKYGYLSQSKKCFFIQFFSKTKAFT